MKVWCVLLLLLPLCMGDHQITCYGEDFLMLRNQILKCSSKTRQGCYTRDTGERGCAREEFCKKAGWTCCWEDYCNQLPASP